MKLFFFSFIIFLAACSDRSNSSALAGKQKFSKGQLFLNDLKESLVTEYAAAGSKTQKQYVLERYHQRLERYLMNYSIDSIKVTIDEVLVKDSTITTKSHFNGIQFQYSLTFNGYMTPRLDSIYEFMKSLRKGSDTLANFSFTGACQVNSPDSTNLWTFRIFAFPFPLQYAKK